MTEISTMYDSIVSRMAALYTSGNGYHRLVFPYQLERNPETLLEQGYAIALGDGENTNRELACRRSQLRNFIITFTRKYYALDHDVANKSNAEKLLMEDARILFDDVMNNMQITDDNGLIQAVSDDGIQTIFTENDRPYLALPCTVSVEYFRSI